MKNFKDLELPEELMKSLYTMGYETPTPIQAKAIPLTMEGMDILGSAQTGTGKTAAFAIPMLCKLLNNPGSGGIILTPTRELATQVMEVIKQMIGEKNRNIRGTLLIGGGSMGKQLRELKNGVQFIVGTPGRVNDHLKRKSLNLKNFDFLVLDEADRMLDMGFGIQIDGIVKHLPKERQTLMFSATIPKEIIQLTEKYLNNPKRVAVDSSNSAVAKIKQDFIRVAEAEKYGTLLSELETRKGSIIIFVKTKRGADQLSIRLNNKNHNSNSIHGDLRQRIRERVIKSFNERKYRIMVATDVAARGLDIPHIEHVINYDLPQSPEDYIHRIGRTGRAGAEGFSLCIITPQDNSKWRAIDRLMHPDKHKGSSDNKGPFRRRRPGGERFSSNRGPSKGPGSSRGGDKGFKFKHLAKGKRQSIKKKQAKAVRV